jgi:hypothetical protein
MHDFIFGTGSAPRLRRLGSVLEPHQHLYFRAQRAPVEFEGFLAAPIEKEVGLNQPMISVGAHDSISFDVCVRPNDDEPGR